MNGEHERLEEIEDNEIVEVKSHHTNDYVELTDEYLTDDKLMEYAIRLPSEIREQLHRDYTSNRQWVRDMIRLMGDDIAAQIILG